MMSYTDMATLVGSAKTAVDMALGMSKLKDQAEYSAKALEMHAHLASLLAELAQASIAQHAAQDEARDLRKQLDDLRNTLRDLERYKLNTPFPGVVVYALDEAKSNGEPPHYLCATCYPKGIKSILNSADINHWQFFKCFVCNAQVRTEYTGGFSPEYAS